MLKFKISLLLVFIKLCLGQLRDFTNANWAPENIFTIQQNQLQSGVKPTYTTQKEESKYGFSFMATNLNSVPSNTEIFKAVDTSTNWMLRMINKASKTIEFQYNINGVQQLSCDIQADTNWDASLLQHFYIGVSIPRWEAFAYFKDSKTYFGQTDNGTCMFDGPNLPSLPSTTRLPNNTVLTLSFHTSLTVSDIVFYTDYFPATFLGLLADTNPDGAKLHSRYIMPDFIRNRLFDVSNDKKHIVLSNGNRGPEGLMLNSTILTIAQVQRKIGLNFVLSFWVKITPKDFNEKFTLVELKTTSGDLVYALNVLDLKAIAAQDINANALPRLIALNKWFHVTIHSYSDDNQRTFTDTYIYKVEQKQPNRHYEKIIYNKQFQEQDDYDIILGDSVMSQQTDKPYAFQVDDVTFIGGGTIYGTASTSRQVDNCVTRVGLKELNDQITADSKSEFICVLCEQGFYAHKDKCVDANTCKIKDETKRLCKDIDIDDLGENLFLIVEYVKSLRNGHKIRIIVPSILIVFQRDENGDLTQENDFFYKIPGFTFNQNFFAQTQPQKIRENVFEVDITFENSIDNPIPLTIDLRENELKLISGFIELPPVNFVSLDFVETTDSVYAGFTGTVISVAVASTVPMALTGHMSFFWGLFDILQLVSLMMYINAPYPIHVESFFDKLGVAELNWLPNWAKDFALNIMNAFSEDFSYEIEDQVAPYRFDLKEYSANFVENGGQILSLQLLLILFSSFVTFLRKLTAKRFLRAARLLRKIEKFIDVNFFIRDFEATSLPLMMAVMLQISAISTINVLNRVSAGLAFFALAYCLFIMVYLWRISHHSRKPMKPAEKKQFINSFSAVFEGVNLQTKMGSYSFFLLGLKKFGLLYFLVYYQVVPQMQILCLTGIWALSWICELRSRSKIEKKAVRVIRITEFLMMVAHMLVFMYIFKIAQTNKSRNITGWIIIGIIVSVIMANIILIVQEEIVHFKEVVLQCKRSMKRARNTFKQRNSVRIRRQSRVSRPSIRLKRVDKFNPADLKEFGAAFPPELLGQPDESKPKRPQNPFAKSKTQMAESDLPSPPKQQDIIPNPLANKIQGKMKTSRDSKSSSSGESKADSMNKAPPDGGMLTEGRENFLEEQRRLNKSKTQLPPANPRITRMIRRTRTRTQKKQEDDQEENPKMEEKRDVHIDLD